MRDKAASIIQEQKLSAQITKIVAERGQEMLRTTTMPEMLWPEAIRHAVWLKYRSPTKAHKYKKTPFEAVEGIKPDFSRERVWGSRAYVTIPIETRMGEPKLHTSRGWLGYFVGCESEKIYRIWNPDKEKVMRISVARIEDDVGQDDFHDHDALADRVPEITPANKETHQDNDDVSELSHVTSTASMSDDDESDSDSSDARENDSEPNSGYDLKNMGDGILHLEDENAEPAELVPSEESENDYPNSDESNNEVVVSKYFQDGRANIVAIGRGISIKEKLAKCANCLKLKQRCDGQRPCSSCKKFKRKCRDLMKETKEEIRRDPPKTVGRTPDDTKCDFCMKTYAFCDGNRPCSRCTTLSRVCKEQTEATKDLIPEENRHLPPIPKLGRKPSITRCIECRKVGRCCDEVRPCSRCKKQNIECVLSPEKSVPKKDRCNHCRSTNHKCNGQIPCARCESKGLTCVSQEDRKKPKCGTCTNHRRVCDRGRPCSTCLKNNTVCPYTKAEGLVRRCYNLQEYKDISDDEAECVHYQSKKRQCTGTEPCYQCVKHKNGVCTYRKKGRSKEMYYTNHFTINDNDGVEFNKEQPLQGKRPRRRKSKPQSPVPDTDSESHTPIEEGDNDLDDDLDEDIRPAKKTRPNPPIVAAAPPPKRVTDEPQTYKAAMRLLNTKYYKQATEEEMQSIITNNVFKLVNLPQDRHAITAQWVFKKKMGVDGQVVKYKARIVGRGFQQHEGLDF